LAQLGPGNWHQSLTITTSTTRGRSGIFSPAPGPLIPTKDSFIMLQVNHYDVKGCLIKTGLGEAAIGVQ
jgi:hypothetical protein